MVLFWVWFYMIKSKDSHIWHYSNAKHGKMRPDGTNRAKQYKAGPKQCQPGTNRTNLDQIGQPETTGADWSWPEQTRPCNGLNPTSHVVSDSVSPPLRNQGSSPFWPHVARNFSEIPFELHSNTLETHWKLSWNTIQFPLKHSWNALRTFLKHTCNILETFLKLPWTPF